MPLTQTEELERLLWQLNFLTGDDMQRILDQCKNAPREAIEKIIAVLEQGVIKQDEILEKLVQKDPDFPKKFDGFMKEQICSAAVMHETEEQKRTEGIFDDD